MLVVVGANGRTGIEVVKEALRRGRQVRAVVRDDRDARNLDDVIDVQHISYADPEHYAALVPALQGATEVIAAIDPRTGGPGAPVYGDEAAPNVIRAAKDAGANAIIYLSVIIYLPAKRELESGIGETPVMCTTVEDQWIDNDMEMCK